MPITVDEILKHREVHGISQGIQDMGLIEYQHALNQEAIIFVDSHGFLVDSFSGMPLAADGEQLTLLIQYLERLRSEMPDHNIEQLIKG